MPAEVTQPSSTTTETPVAAQPSTEGGVVQPAIAPSAPASVSTAAPVVDGAVPAAVAPVLQADAAPAATQGNSSSVGSGSGELRFNFDRDAWVEVKDASGSIVFSQLSPAGSERVVRGQPPFQLVVGNAGGVKVTYNTRTVDLAPHTRTDVARVTLE